MKEIKETKKSANRAKTETAKSKTTEKNIVKMPSEKQSKSTATKTAEEKMSGKPTKKSEVTSSRMDEKVKPSARVNKKTPKPNSTAAKGIVTSPAYPDVSFPEGGNNGEIVGMSKSPSKKRGK